MIGKRLAHYDILEKIGAGGMGEVFRAHDTKLDRAVAVKVLPPQIMQDPDRGMRFEREAKAIAALRHPNIVTIYSVEEADGIAFFTMELLEVERSRRASQPRGSNSGSSSRWRSASPTRLVLRTRVESSTGISSRVTSCSNTAGR